MNSATENIVVLGTYPNSVEAHLARTRLEAAGIPCFLSNETLVTLNVMYSPASGGVRLHVYARDVATAAEALRQPPHMHAERGGLAPLTDLKEAPEATTAMVCPRCGSLDVGSDEAVTASWWAGLRAWLRRHLGSGHAYHCFSCGLDFNQTRDG